MTGRLVIIAGGRAGAFSINDCAAVADAAPCQPDLHHRLRGAGRHRH